MFNSPDDAHNPFLRDYENQFSANHDPLAEAREMVAGLQPSKGARVFLFGLGMGHCIRALFESRPEAEITVHEPDKEIINAFIRRKKELQIPDGFLCIMDEWDAFTYEVIQEILYGKSSKPPILVAPGYTALYPADVDTLKFAVEGALLRRTTNDKTIAEKGDLFLRHLTCNIPELLKHPLVTGLENCLTGVPGFIVGSGPSLDINEKLLRTLQNKGIVIAAASAVKPLMRMGISPDIVVVIEAEDTSDYLAENDEALHAFGSTSHPSHFKVKNKILTPFHMTAGTAFLFGEDKFIPQGGTAGSAAFTVGLALGLNPLILLGQDMAFKRNGIHAKYTPGDTPVADENVLFRIHGFDQQSVLTHSAFFSSLHWFAEAIRHVKATRPGIKVFNCSEGGAYIPGVPNTPLSSLFDAFINLEDVSIDLSRIAAEAPLPDPAILRTNLLTALDLVNKASAILSRSEQEGLAVVNELRRCHPFFDENLYASGVQEDSAVVKTRLRRIETVLLDMLEMLNESV